MNEDAFPKKTLQEFQENVATEEGVWKLTETLMTELEIHRKENRVLRNELDHILNKNESISCLYLDIEKYNLKLKDEIETLKSEAKEQMSQFQTEIMEIKAAYESKLKISSDQYKKLEQKLNKKEKEFFEELQMAQATAAYEFGEIEKKLKWQLSESNKQLYEKNMINSRLRTQLENVEKMREEDSINKKSVSVEVSDSIISNLDTKTMRLEKTNYTCLRTYEPLQVESCLLETKCERQTPTLYKGKSRYNKNSGGFKGNSLNTKNPTLPPLLPCSNSSSANQKRRKLHDPDDLSYLTDLIPSEDNQ